MFDAHLHLRDERITSSRQRFLAEACEVGLKGCIDCACFPEQWETKIVSSFDITTAYGLHPWRANVAPAGWLQYLEALLVTHPKALVGEIGLDRLRQVTDGGAAQRECFLAQIELAVRYQRPIICHGARAWHSLFDLLMPWMAHLPAVMLHGVSFSVELLKHPFFKHSTIWLGIGGGLLARGTKTLPTLVRHLPINRIVVETDAPDGFPLSGEPFILGQRQAPLNHPVNLRLILERLAQLLNVSVDELNAKTEANARAFTSVC